MSPDRFISYAQNGEDVVLARLFRDRPFGWYVDVGAAHPVEDSVTKHFYDLGWRGINLEPNPELFTLLQQARPEDVNLPLAVADEPGRATLHLYGDPTLWGTATLDEREVARNAQYERHVEVEVSTLAAVWARYGQGRAVDFLKIDVEGHERKVLLGIDFAELRPRVVIVESTRPNSTDQTQGEWEDLLLAAGYGCVLFDGLNRFYALPGDDEAAERLGSPANVLDLYRRHDHQAALDEADTLRARFDLLSQQTLQLAQQTLDLRLRMEQLAAERASAPAREAQGAPAGSRAGPLPVRSA